MRRLLALMMTLALFAAACGDDGDANADADADPDPDEATEPADEPEPEEEPAPEPEPEEEPAEEPAEEPEPEEEPAEEPAPEPVDEPSATTVAVTLSEGTLTTEAALAAGSFTFEISNVGQFPHQFGITRGTAYEDLPLLDNGAIDEEALGDDFLGKTDNFDSGAGGSIDFDLEPGSYVFFCNISFGPNSHAANGQVLSVTVT